jgi:hypothetical protein
MRRKACQGHAGYWVKPANEGAADALGTKIAAELAVIRHGGMVSGARPASQEDQVRRHRRHENNALSQ